jgi:hypothetical protein
MARYDRSLMKQIKEVDAATSRSGSVEELLCNDMPEEEPELNQDIIYRLQKEYKAQLNGECMSV